MTRRLARCRVSPPAVIAWCWLACCAPFVAAPAEDPRQATAADALPVPMAALRVQRDELIRSLAGQGISSGIHYPIPVHLQEAYRSLGLARGAFPVAERCADEFVSLPMFPELTPGQVEAVAGAVRAWVSSSLVAA